jgi:hypothetical protein
MSQDNLHVGNDSRSKLMNGIRKAASAVGSTKRVPWNKGLKTPAHVRKKQSLARMGKAPWNKGTKGVMKPNITSFKKGHKTRNPFKSEQVSGPNNVKWKGDKVGYDGLHDWISYHYGKPHYCEFCERTELPHRSYNWANKTGKYTRDRDDWMRLCVSCHKKYDIKNKISKKLVYA